VQQRVDRRRRPVLVVVVSAVLSVVVAVAGALVGSSRAPDVPRVLPPPATAATDTGAIAPGFEREEPWTPAAIVADDPWALFDELEGVAPWRPELPALRFGRDEAVGDFFVEDAVVITDPAPCYRLARVVRGVGVDLDEPAASLVAQQLMAWLDPAYFAGVDPPAGLHGCRTRDRSQWGFAIEQVAPLPCAMPGHDVRCFRTADWRHDFGPRDVWWVSHLVFDATSGERLPDTGLHPDLDLPALHEQVAEVLCDAAVTCDPVLWRDGQMLPLADALVLELSPGDLAEADEGVRLRIARDVLPTRSP
jgi:hypothetical protein